jgi:hypothetical protein
VEHAVHSNEGSDEIMFCTVESNLVLVKVQAICGSGVVSCFQSGLAMLVVLGLVALGDGLEGARANVLVGVEAGISVDCHQLSQFAEAQNKRCHCVPNPKLCLRIDAFRPRTRIRPKQFGRLGGTV